ncbi:polysaccharide biosynthesis protein [Mucilaginibacter sabulilitoris]
MKKLFNNNEMLPKMVVMLIDLTIIVLAFSMSFLLIPPVWLIEPEQKYFLIYLALYTAISFVVFYKMKIPNNMMRYSNIPDLFKLFTAVLITCAFFDAVVQVILLFYNIPAIVQSFLVINMAISSMALIMFRIGIKGVFAQLKKLPEASVIGNGGEILIFDMGEPVKIIDLVRKMISMSGAVPDQDIKIIFSGLRPGEKLYEELLKNDECSVPSPHAKIRISLAGKNQWYGINEHIADLTLLVKGSDIDIVRKIKEAVPEFISNNSVYEVLDAENKNIHTIRKLIFNA